MQSPGFLYSHVDVSGKSVLISRSSVDGALNVSFTPGEYVGLRFKGTGADKKEARYKGQYLFFPGTIVASYAHGLYDVAHDDGCIDYRVRAELIRPLVSIQLSKFHPLSLSLSLSSYSN